MSLAKELGKTLEELEVGQPMPLTEREAHLWIAYSEWERKQIEKS